MEVAIEHQSVPLLINETLLPIDDEDPEDPKQVGLPLFRNSFISMRSQQDPLGCFDGTYSWPLLSYTIHFLFPCGLCPFSNRFVHLFSLGFQTIMSYEFQVVLIVLDYIGYVLSLLTPEANFFRDICLIAHFFVRARVSFIKNGLLITDPRMMALHYIKSKSFIIDLCSTIPFDVIFWGQRLDCMCTHAMLLELTPSVHYWLRLTRLFRLLTTFSLFDSFELRSMRPYLVPILAHPL